MLSRKRHRPETGRGSTSSRPTSASVSPPDTSSAALVSELRRALDEERRRNRELTRRHRGKSTDAELQAASKLRRQVDDLKESKKKVEDELRRVVEADREKQIRLAKQREEFEVKIAKLTKANRREAAILMEQLKNKSRQVEQLEKQVSVSASRATRLQHERDEAVRKQLAIVSSPVVTSSTVSSAVPGGTMVHVTPPSVDTGHQAAVRELASPDSGLSSIPEDSDEDKDSVKSSPQSQTPHSSSQHHVSPLKSSARCRSLQEIRSSPRPSPVRPRVKQQQTNKRSRVDNKRFISNKDVPKSPAVSAAPGHLQESPQVSHYHCVERVRRLTDQVESLQSSRALYRRYLEEAWDTGELLEFRLLEMEAQHEAMQAQLAKAKVSKDVREQSSQTSSDSPQLYHELEESNLELSRLKRQIELLQQFIQDSGFGEILSRSDTDLHLLHRTDPNVRTPSIGSAMDLSDSRMSGSVQLTTVEDCRSAMISTTVSLNDVPAAVH